MPDRVVVLLCWPEQNRGGEREEREGRIGIQIKFS
jgi:hypothetical protein